MMNVHLDVHKRKGRRSVSVCLHFHDGRSGQEQSAVSLNAWCPALFLGKLSAVRQAPPVISPQRVVWRWNHGMCWRAVDIKRLPQLGWPHNPDSRMSLKTPIQSVIARHQITELHCLGLRHHTAVVGASVLLQEFVDAPLEDRLGDARIMIEQLVPRHPRGSTDCQPFVPTVENLVAGACNRRYLRLWSGAA